MPIYEYRCTACGFQKEYLQKVSDPPHTVCPQCAESTFAKKLTAAGFQLKGTGWYVTDFRNGSTPAKKADGEDKPAARDGKADDAAESGTKSDTKSDAKSDTKSESSAGTAAAAAPVPAPSAPKPAAKPGDTA